METKSVETICVVGASFMGTQIGLHCAVYGYTVRIVDISRDVMKKAAEMQRLELESRVKAGQLTPEEMKAIRNRISFTRDIAKGAAGADLAIESVTERLEIKRDVFMQLDRVCPAHTLLATNSSSLRISAIEDATRRPEKVLNLHFYPPVWERPMVELMRGTQTSDETIETMRRFARTLKLTPLTVLRESTGFIFNRIWRVIKKEALNLVDEGVATHEDVDRAWIIATGMPIGIFGLMDMIGLDVVREIEMVYQQESGEEKDLPPKLLHHKIEKKELGVKTGKGFYTYPDPVFNEPRWLRGS